MQINQTLQTNRVLPQDLLEIYFLDDLELLEEGGEKTNAISCGEDRGVGLPVNRYSKLPKLTFADVITFRKESGIGDAEGGEAG